MKVLYDHQIFELQNIGGISRYFAELLAHNSMAQLSLKYSDNVYLQESVYKDYGILPKNHECKVFLPSIKFKGKRRLCKIYTKMCNKIYNKKTLSLSVKNLKKSNYDIFHPTYYDTYFLKYLKHKPFVLTVYDMIHELFPYYYFNDVNNENTILNKQYLISQANTIISISESTKKDILRFFPDLSEKIKVIYLGSSFQQLDRRVKKERFILFTGLRTNYKNFDVFIQTVAPLLLKYDLRLICTGPPFNTTENALLEELNICDRVISKFASDEELKDLYAKALVFVFPSLYEGFGIPVLEAFASGCPAILSNTSSLPEVGGDAALYFDPYSPDDMRNQIERVITSPSLRGEMAAKGKERLKMFSWKKCAEETMEVYKKLM
ncbi:MAG: glycosyltransferase family 4 protein [Treponema sp.]|nr:glycosyltransferase family 4 protein [Treponema sp.]